MASYKISVFYLIEDFSVNIKVAHCEFEFHTLVEVDEWLLCVAAADTSPLLKLTLTCDTFGSRDGRLTETVGAICDGVIRRARN